MWFKRVKNRQKWFWLFYFFVEKLYVTKLKKIYIYIYIYDYMYCKDSYNLVRLCIILGEVDAFGVEENLDFEDFLKEKRLVTWQVKGAKSFSYDET